MNDKPDSKPDSKPKKNAVHMVDVMVLGDVTIVRIAGSMVEGNKPSPYASCLLSFKTEDQEAFAEFLAKAAEEIKRKFPNPKEGGR